MQRIPERAIADKNGDRKSWTEVRDIMHYNLSGRFYRVNADIIDEAVEDTLLRLMTYWQQLESSRKAELLTFEYALHYGQRFAATLIYGEIRRQSVEISHTFQDARSDIEEYIDTDLQPAFEDNDYRQRPGSGSLDQALGLAIQDTQSLDPTPEDACIEADEAERARRVLEDLSPAELEDWFNNLLTPETEREQADREGVNRNAVHERRVIRRTRAQQKARKYGLFV